MSQLRCVAARRAAAGMPSPLAGEGSMVLPPARLGEGCSYKAAPSPIRIGVSTELPSPGTSAFTRVFDALRGEGTRSASAFAAAIALPHIHDEIEPCRHAVAGVGGAHQELAAEQAVAPVRRLVGGKIELGGEHRPLRCLHLHVIMAGAARVLGGEECAGGGAGLPGRGG